MPFVLCVLILRSALLSTHARVVAVRRRWVAQTQRRSHSGRRPFHFADRPPIRMLLLPSLCMPLLAAVPAALHCTALVEPGSADR